MQKSFRTTKEDSFNYFLYICSKKVGIVHLYLDQTPIKKKKH